MKEPNQMTGSLKITKIPKESTWAEETEECKIFIFNKIKSYAILKKKVDFF